MRIVKKWYEKYPEIKVDEVNAATAWDLDFKQYRLLREKGELF